MPVYFLSFNSWWQSLEGFDKIFWFIAILFTILFVGQTIMSFVGGDADDSFGDADMAVESDEGIGYGFLTIKNFIAFFTVFGWAGIALSGTGMGRFPIIIFAFLAGCAVVAMMFFIMRSMSNLKESGTLQIQNAVGKTATVYLPIPANRQGVGKISITLQGSLRDLSAVTGENNDIETGRFVKVTGVLEGDVLEVSTI